MSTALTIQTDCADISEVIHTFAERAEESQFILYGPNPLEEDNQIPFSILLQDKTPALQGQGKVIACVDGGEERDTETRYDIILTELSFSGSHEVVYETMVMTSSAQPNTPESSQKNTPSNSSSESEAINEWTSKPQTELPTPKSISLNFETPEAIELTRSKVQTSWEPKPPKRNTIQPASGLFQYEKELPIPETIPLPNRMKAKEGIEELSLEEAEELDTAEGLSVEEKNEEINQE